MNLDRLLQPRSVAIVGASAEPAKISGMIVEFLRRSGFAGRVYPVNPRYETIGEFKCYPSVDALPETVDLVVCVIPVAVVFDAIESAARRGVPFCLLMTGGFGEGRSGEQGQARRRRLDALCRETGMHVVGPNTVGMVNFRQRLPLTFADWYGRDTGLRGGVAIVTHSGSVGGLIFSALQIDGIGVDYWIGLGNEATLEVADFIGHFSDDPGIHTVICYIEGVRDGRNFLAAAAKARSRGKRVVVVKAGAHPESLRSTLSHTGKRPTSADVYTGLFRQSGVIQASSLSELGYMMTLLQAFGAVGPRVGILAASGGACSLFADHVIDAGLQLPLLSEGLQRQLDRCIPEYGASHNPVDLSADVVARGEILSGTLAVLADSDEVDVWMVFGRPIIDRYADVLIEFTRTSGKPLIACSGVPLAEPLRERLRQGGVAVLLDPQLCMNALGGIERARGPQDEAGRDAQAGASAKAGCDGPDDAGMRGGAGPASTGVRRLKGADAAALLTQAGWQQGAGPATLGVEIAVDPDFGPVVAVAALSHAGGRSRRAVRALPAGVAVLRDAAHELAGLAGGLPVPAEEAGRAVAAVVHAYRSTPDLAGLEVAFAISPGAAQLAVYGGGGAVEPGAADDVEADAAAARAKGPPAGLA
ncbi:hypothetical protein GCM10023144_03320 [Pigmentiphaga soli]|uniref:CoA-binding domain-containing protein n=1 Tax=Pigmentiphaga soli TaxID=1007095 RepID=A0ABP8GEH0_9BURK